MTAIDTIGFFYAIRWWFSSGYRLQSFVESGSAIEERYCSGTSFFLLNVIVF